MKPWIMNCSQAWILSIDPRPDTVVISITGRTCEVVRFLPGYADILHLRFDDIDPLRHQINGATSGYWIFGRTHAGKIVAFAHQHRGKNFLVHCAAGISRSAAVVESILRAFPEYQDHGGMRAPNGHVLSVLNRAFGNTPIGVEP